MKTVEAEIVKDSGEKQQSTQALQVRESGGEVGRAMSVDELKENLSFIKEVMRTVMVEGQDYGKVPGCGDKPGLFQPGAQKLCMTFQLTDEVKEERVVDFPNYHREYSFVVRLTSKAGRSWEGVGTCSSLESKYRYRKAERSCPKCGRTAIIKGKAEYGGGWVCFNKKGGCGAKFSDNDTAITSQPGGSVENENPADHWNTVRKMAFKRALVHASINATNTSELWSQDLEDLDGNRGSTPSEAPEPPKMPQERPATTAVKTPTPAQNVAPTPTPQTNQAIPFPTEESRKKMISALNADIGQPSRHVVTEFFIKAGVILPNESLEEIPLRYVPAMTSQMRALGLAIAGFEAGEPAEIPYQSHVEPLKKPTTTQAPKQQELETQPEPKTEDPDSARLARHYNYMKENPSPESKQEKRSEYFFDVIVPIPRKGMKKTEYLQNPDTIGSLYDKRHGDDDESAVARQRLWGLVNNFEPKPWTMKNGTVVQPSDSDKQFRVALDDFADWFEKNHPDEKL